MNYRFVYCFFSFFLRLWHPVFRVEGRENLPSDTHAVYCANHRGMADPIWILLALRLPRLPKIMAKDVLMHIPLLGSVLRSLGAFGVRRGENDLNAVKSAIRFLREGQSLLLFPEGTRVRPGKTVPPKSGAVLFACRAGVPIVPVYIERRRYPFSPMRCVIGRPITFPLSEKPTPPQLHAASQELMQTIYRLGETV